ERRVARLAFEGEDLTALGERQMADVRGRRMGMIFQDPMTSLNPSYTVGNQLEETYLRHNRASRREARDRALDLLETVGIAAAPSRLKQYPHQLSGGLRQRVMIAMALMCGPDLILADEPTTALDVTIQAQILRLLASLQDQFHMGMILITHDLGIVARVATKVAVMYAGQIVETGTVAEVFAEPVHPYTQALLRCIPVPGQSKRGEHLGSIAGVVPTLFGEMRGCHFRNRCAFSNERCEPDAVGFEDIGPDRGYRCVLSREQCRANADQEIAS
ncbi:MAG: ABC transporter ATP-binding protein, partial [Rhodospirillales bacterium]|nr:ABC transporter ATP-binding protein [Rhodospirillales bacterium]